MDKQLDEILWDVEREYLKDESDKHNVDIRAEAKAAINELILEARIEELEKALQVSLNHKMDNIGDVYEVLYDRLETLKGEASNER